MKANLLATLGLFAVLTATAAQRVELQQVPSAVRQTIITQQADRSNGGLLIEKGQEGSMEVYDVEFPQSGQNTRLRLSAQGRILKDSRDAIGTTPLGHAQQVAEKDIPITVRQTLQHEGAPANARVDRNVKDGKTVFQARFEQHGKQAMMEIAQDGTILRDNREKTTVLENLVSRTIIHEGV